MKSGAMAEPAISLDGRLIAQRNDGSLDFITLEEFQKDRSNESRGYNILSVSALANLRAYDPKLSHN